LKKADRPVAAGAAVPCRACRAGDFTPLRLVLRHKIAMLDTELPESEERA
jgi:hypothetical protein